MKRIGINLLIMLTLMSFQITPEYDFSKAWKDVDGLITRGLPESAMEKVEEIYNQAENESNNVQLIKAIGYKSTLLVELSDRGSLDHLDYLESEVDKLASSPKALVQLLLIKAYRDYYSRNSYEISQRTDVNEATDDIRFWSPGNFETELNTLILSVLSLKESLQTDISEYDILLDEYNEEGIRRRPTLLDVVTQQILEWYNSPLVGSSDFRDDELKNNPLFLAPVDTFLMQDLESFRSSNYITSLSIYKQILVYHQSQGNDLAFIDAEISRLKYVHRQSRYADRHTLYLAAMDYLSEKYESEEILSQLAFEKGSFYFSHSKQDDLQYGDWRVKAFELVENVDTSTYFGNKCKQLLHQITQPSLSATVKEVVTSQEQPTFSITANNLSKSEYKIVKLPKDYREKVSNFYGNTFISYLDNQDVVSAGSITFHQGSDYFSTETIFKHDPLSYGIYAMILTEGNAYYYLIFQVSDLAYGSFDHNGISLLITDRITGAPQKDVKVKIYAHDYDRVNRRNVKSLVTTLTSNENGRVSYQKTNSRRSLQVILEKGSDYLDLNDNFYINDYPKESEVSNYMTIFTDRSIYRPGQTLYFKGLFLQRDNKGIPHILTKQKVEVSLHDANGQEVQTLELTTNEYGSFYSSFNLPPTGLTGNFNIQVRSGIGGSGFKSIRVEEYRRPKFEVTLESPREGFKIGDTIVVQGSARGYSGINITDAEVEVKVFRSQLRRWWYYWRPQPEDKQLVKAISTVTDDKGNFELAFPALGNQGENWQFDIEADVTDLSGETRSATNSIYVTERDKVVRLQGEDLFDKNDKNNIELVIENLSGEKLNLPISYSIVKLKDPGYLIEVSSNSIYRRSNELIQILEQWKFEKLMKNGSIKGEDKKEIDVTGLEAGGYKLIVKVGDFEENIYFALTDFTSRNFPFVKNLFVRKSKSNYQPGEKVKLEMGTPHGALYVFLREDLQHIEGKEKWLKLENKKVYEYDVIEEDYGGFAFNFTFFKNNSASNIKEIVQVPWKHKALDIEFITWRDNLLPGQKESWKLKIKGPDKDEVAAEVLASMYDMSLDQFVHHQWSTGFYSTFSGNKYVRIRGYNMTSGYHLNRGWNRRVVVTRNTDVIQYPYIKLLHSGMYANVVLRGRASGVSISKDAAVPSAAPMAEAKEMEESALDEQDDMMIAKDEQQTQQQEGPPQLRTNLNETVFFFPELKTDKEGNVILNFTMGEALTRWKLMLFAHDKEMRYGTVTKEVITQKELMVFPYPPRFLRQGDQLTFSGKVSNVSDKDIEAKATIKWLNARTLEDVTQKILATSPNIDISLPQGGSQSVSWELIIPEDFLEPLIYQVAVKSDNHSDGEEGMIPVLSNKILVTHTEAISLQDKEKYEIKIDNLVNLSESAEVINLTFDYTAHPVWTAIQALPTMADYPHDCTEQMTNKFMAHALGSKIMNDLPNIKAIMQQWRDASSTALLSNLEKNQELKTAILSETPWVRAAASESEQKKAIAVLLDLNQLSYEKDNYLKKIEQAQLSSGGFPWFAGGRANTYITQYILESFARMEDIRIIDRQESGIQNLVKRAISFIDLEIRNRYLRLQDHIQKYGGNLEDDHLSSLDIHYLFVRSMFTDILMPSDTEEAVNYYTKQAYQYWINKSDYNKGMIGLMAWRNSNENVVSDITASLKERAMKNEKLGNYWKQTPSFYWYELPVETHTILLELFQKATDDNAFVNGLKLWLLNNKRTNSWPTTKSTAAAIYALLYERNGDQISWVNNVSAPDILVNALPLTLTGEAASGYVKKSWKGSEVDQVKSLSVTNNNDNVAWGGIYLQYLERTDKAVGEGNEEMAVRKSLYKKVSTADGDQLIPITQEELKVGDLLISRIEIEVDRDMEFVHLKDLRASGLEPVNVLSGYRWKGGLGYYESTKDIASHFFIDHLRKGNYVFEYPLRVSHAGTFDNGITTLQCMYAPEFSSHTGSQKVVVE